LKGLKSFYEKFLEAFKNIIEDANIEGIQLTVGQKRLSVIHGKIEDKYIFEIFLPLSLNVEKTLKSIHYNLSLEKPIDKEFDRAVIFENARPKDGYTYGLYRCKGGTFRVYIKEKNRVLEDIFINGDYIMFLGYYIKSLENFLIGKKIEDVKTL